MRSFAKINIGLNILDKRSDGYHNLETIFAPINVFDEIIIRDESRKIQIVTRNKHIPSGETNICYKAAKKILDFAKINTGVVIEINKKIPVGAGLGGGSSNAASVLKQLIDQYNISITQEELNRIGLELGSDVPYFLNNGIAYALGRGEILDYINVEIPYWILTIYPSLSISTRWAFSIIIEKENPRKSDFKNILLNNIDSADKLRSELKNDFEDFVFIKYAGLLNIKNELYEKGAEYASLSGSGSSMYGFFKDYDDLLRADNLFSSRFKTFITQPGFLTEEYL